MRYVKKDALTLGLFSFHYLSINILISKTYSTYLNNFHMFYLKFLKIYLIAFIAVFISVFFGSKGIVVLLY